MTKHLDLNNDWKYSTVCTRGMLEKEYAENGMEEVRIPHTNTELPYNCFNEQQYQFVSCYRRHLMAETEWSEKQVLLTFDGVDHVATDYINGKKAVTHQGGYTAFTVDLVPYLEFGQDNVIAVEVDSRESSNIPPFGYVIDYLTYGGIYREVSLDIREKTSIADAFITTENRPSENKQSVTVRVSLGGQQIQEDVVLAYQLVDRDGKQVAGGKSTVSTMEKTLCFETEGVQDWEITNPYMYTLELTLSDKNENLLDEHSVRFGFRTCEFRRDGFYLNGKKIKLIGLNRHQSYPYAGYAMPKRLQERDAEILKEELQVNAVRTSHYPQSQHFINRCDELGLLVFTEIPGWQHIGDKEWQNVACEQVREMVTQYRNHPSIVLWGVRINESLDNDEFYTRTNQIAHELDPSRQTGGVRFLKKSHLLEDVYTYNDFLHNGSTKGIDSKKDVTSNDKAPYLVSEFNGHMYPTKPFDDEAHRLEHALRHSCVLDALFSEKEVAGGFGWCMFDYNTHKDFGSGDRICYHGVMDMFRNPKFAASVYASQGERHPVCEISSSLSIGEHPACNIGKVYAFTNADSIRLYKNGTFVKEFHASRNFHGNLPHPPVLIDDFVGELFETQEKYSHRTAEALKEVLFAVRDYGQNNLPLKYKLKMARIILREHMDMEEGIRLYYKYIGSWGGEATTFRFEAIQNNEVVRVIEKNPSGKAVLQILPGTQTLKEAETYDATEIRIQANDEFGNRLSYYQEPVRLEAWGAVELIGPDLISLKGGAAGTYVKTRGEKGQGGLKIHQADLGTTEILFQVN